MTDMEAGNMHGEVFINFICMTRWYYFWFMFLIGFKILVSI